MELLTAVNIALPWLEENVVTGISTSHPTIAALTSKLDYHRGLVLDRGYWFNKESKTYYPNGVGEVAAPLNVRTFYTVDGSLNYEVRGDRIYNLAEGSYSIPSSFEAYTHTDLAFEELPEAAANVVLWHSIIDTYLPDFGVTQAVSGMQLNLQSATALLEREHLRKSRYNSFKTRPGGRFLRALRS